MNNRLESLFEFLQKEPNDSFLKYAIATEYLKSGNFELALKYYEDVHYSDPEYVGNYYHLAKLHEQLGNKENAALIYQKGILVAEKLKNAHALSELKSAFAIMNDPYADE